MIERVERFAALLLERLPPQSRVLEIGAGDGSLAKRLADAGHAVTAIDKERRGDYPVLATSFEAFEAEDAGFDCVLSQLVLHRAADLEQMLLKIRRLLAPQGIVAIDDYGWERSNDAAFRENRSDLHTSQAMLSALRARFDETYYGEHGYVRGAEGDPPLGFTFIGMRAT